MKKLLAILLALVMVLGMAACGTNEVAPEPTPSDSASPSSEPAPEPAAATEIYFLNFKPEIAEVYGKVAEAYEAETGVKVNVVTAAAGTYEQTLISEVAKADAPTIFQINGPVGLKNWKDYCLDLSKTDLYSWLSDQSIAVADGDGVYGIPYVVEGYGIIYNDAILRAYCETEGALVKSASEINNYATLKAVVEDMTAKKEALGIEGVFASTSMGAGQQWRWQTHLANVPFYYEFMEKDGYDNSVLAGLDSETIEFKYAENFKNIFDLYINNSVTAPTLIGAKTVDDSMAEFALGKCAMVQNGNWGAGQILGVEGNTVADADIKFMPIYTGVAGEETQGLCIGTENYFAVNSQVSPEKQAASIAFLEWLFGSATGKAFVSKDLGFLAPFNTFEDSEKPTDPLAKEVLAWMEKDGVKTIAWTFAAFPSEQFKNYFGDALLEYAQGTKSWDEVKQVVIDQWAAEKAANK